MSNPVLIQIITVCRHREDKPNRVCHVLLTVLSFMHISGDQKYYWYLLGIKWCIVYFELYLVEVARKGLILSKEQSQALTSDHSQLCFIFMLRFPKFINFAVVALIYNLVPDVWLTSKLSFSGHQWKVWYEVFLQRGVWY